MDVQMPELDGVAATAQITAQVPATRVIILTTFEREEYVLEGMKAGAKGHVLKEIPADELLGTIRQVHAGECVIQPRLTTCLIAELSRRSGAAPVYEPPTERELAVLRLLAVGRSNKEIGRELALAEGTVKNHVSTILDKPQAALTAREAGLI